MHWQDYANSHPFLVKDVLFSAILVAANEALLEIAALIGAQGEDCTLIANWITCGQRGLDGSWDPEFGLCLDYDLRTGRPLRARTVAGFAPLIAGRQSPERLAALIATLESSAFLGHPDRPRRAAAKRTRLPAPNGCSKRPVLRIVVGVGRVGSEQGACLLAVNEGIPYIVWVVIVVGGVLTVAFTYLFGIEPDWLHAVAVAGLTILVSLILHVIGVLDYPFNSGVQVQPDAFERVLKEIGGKDEP